MLTNIIEKLWVEALQMVALTLIIYIDSIIVCSLTGFSISVSELNKILCQVITFPLNQLTLEKRKKLVLLFNDGKHKLPDKPPLKNPNFTKKSSSDSQTDTYISNNMGKIKDYLMPSDKDKKLNNIWFRIQKEVATQDHAQHQRFIQIFTIIMSQLSLFSQYT